MKPTALVVISDLEFGGAQRQVVELANHMEHYDLHVCTLADYVPLASSLRDRDRRLHLVKRRWHYDVTVAPRLVALARRLEASVIHSFLFDAQIASYVAKRLDGSLAVIGSERNTDYVLSRGNLLAYRFTRDWLDLVIANSGAGADFNSRLIGLPRSRYRVVHNGVNADRFQPGDGSAVRTELGLTAQHEVIGMFASFKRQKNHPFLLRAARLLADRRPHLRLLFVGDELFGGGSNSQDWKRHVLAEMERLGLRDRCLFAGNRPDVERVYRACDLTALPSFFEGTPNVALESMASGVPVVATNVSDNAYVIPDGRAGYVVSLNDELQLADRLERLLADPPLRRQMGSAARAWILSEFTGARLAEKTADVYDEAVRLTRN